MNTKEEDFLLDSFLSIDILTRTYNKTKKAHLTTSQKCLFLSLKLRNLLKFCTIGNSYTHMNTVLLINY